MTTIDPVKLIKAAYADGRKQCKRGAAINDCPHQPGDLRKAWLNGFFDHAEGKK